MRLQDSQANCGPLAVRNALAALGVSRSTQECETLCQTNATVGTTTDNLLKALHALEECDPVKIDESRQDVALLKLDVALRSGRPVILLVDNWSHYVAAVGQLGPRILVADSGDQELVVSKSAGELVQWWARAGVRRAYWAVVL